MPLDDVARTDRMTLQPWAEASLAAALVGATLTFGAPSGWPWALCMGLGAIGGALALMTPGRKAVPPLIWGLGGLSAFALLQTIPLPEPLLRALAPHSAQLVAGAGLDLSAASLRTIALSPPKALTAAAHLTTLALIIAGVSHMARNRATRERLRIAASCALGLTLVWALCQRWFGFYVDLIATRRAERPFVNPMGPFLNADHGAAFILLGLLTALPLFARSRRDAGGRAWHIAPLVAVAVPSLALIFTSDSRAALFSIVIAAMVLIAVVALQRGQKKLLRGMLLLGGVGVMSLPLMLKLLSALTGKAATLGLRGSIWGDGLTLAAAQPLVGIGAGSWGDAIPTMWSAPGGFFAAHAHNEWLELYAEQGAIGVAIWCAALWATARWAWPRIKGLSPGDARWVEIASGAAGAAVLLAHLTVDFHRHLGAVALMAALAMGLASAALPNPTDAASQAASPPRRIWPIAALGAMAALGLVAMQLLGSWPRGPLPPTVERWVRGPQPYLACAKEGLSRQQAKALARARRCAQRAIELAPHSWEAHLLLGRAQLRSKPASGQTSLTRATTLAPTRWEAAWYEGFALLRQGDIDAATPLLRLAVEASRPAKQGPRLAQLWRQPGAGQWIEALSHGLDDARWEAAKLLAVARHPRSLWALELAVSDRPDEILRWRWLMAALEAADAPMAAALDAFSQRFPAEASVWHDRLALRSGDKEAISRLRAHLHDAAPADIALAADALLSAEEVRDLEAPVTLALKTHPEHKMLKLMQVEALMRSGQTAAAKKKLKTLVSLEPFRAHYRHKLAEVLGIDDPIAAHDELVLAGQARPWRPILPELLCHCRDEILAQKRNAAVASAR